MMIRRYVLLLLCFGYWGILYSQQMNVLWGEQGVKSDRTKHDGVPLKLFQDGNYAMFVHWGLYSSLAGEWKGKTYYGIGEWLMSRSLANIPVDEYKQCAGNFNPKAFDAHKLVKLAKDAGMKYIVITSKHHDGFAMYHTKFDDFNIVDATPFARDPMKELSEECRKQGLGFGFYYSQTQDWTAPGGHLGPKTDVQGNPKTFDDYFREKCLPQVKEICTEYGDINIVWFDTPSNISKQHVRQLIDTVRKYQPEALISGRVGHNMGDYRTMGDMDIPDRNEKGLWEAVDVTNDSWGYVWYDKNWKSPKEVLVRLLSTISRGGTYMLNVGPKPDGSIPEPVAFSLEQAGKWVHKYSQVVYDVEPSPWGRAMPWGDCVEKENKLYLLIYDWPSDGNLKFYGLKNSVQSANLLEGAHKNPLEVTARNGWITLKLPLRPADTYVNVVELVLDRKSQVDSTLFLSPNGITTLGISLADNVGNQSKVKQWMEKFGEWKSVPQVSQWTEQAKSVWDIQVMEPGYYQTELNYSGKGRIVWKIQSGDQIVQNQQSSSASYAYKPMGWIYFEKPGKYRIEVSMVDGDRTCASLAGIRFIPIY